MKSLFFFYLITILSFDLHSKQITFNQVRSTYLSISRINFLATKIIKDADKVNNETFLCYMKMKRINNKDFELLYFDPKSTCILKDKSTNQKIKYFNRFVDTFQYFEINKDEIRDCYQLTGVNISGFENPFSECFYHTKTKNNKAPLIDIGNCYFYEMKSNYVGFEKKIWINKITLHVDSIQYSAGTLSKKIYYNYFENTSINNIDSDNYKFRYDSLVLLLKSMPINYILPDSVKISNQISTFDKLTLLDFWFIGCKPCIAGFPKIQVLRDSFSDDFLNIRAINYIDQEMNIIHFKSKYSYRFNLEKDTSNLTNFFKISAFPTILLLDSNGLVLFKIEGNKPDEFLKLIDEIKKRLN